MASHNQNQNQNPIREPPYDPVIVKVLLGQQYDQQKAMLRTQIILKTVELQLAKQKVKAVILQKSILLNRMAQFERGSQMRQALEKQMDVEDLFEQAAQTFKEAIDIDILSVRQDLHILECMGVEKWIEKKEAVVR